MIQLIKDSKIALAIAFVCTLVTNLGFRALFPDDPINASDSLVLLLIFFAVAKAVGILWRRLRPRSEKQEKAPDA